MSDANIVATGVPRDPVVREATVAADPGTVFEALTDAAQIEAWLGVSSRVELRIGGPYELLFSTERPPGSQGSEGCVILSYLPGEMLSFSWNSPPHEPLGALRGSHTWVVITLRSSNDGGTHVRLVHTGMGSGDLWDENRRYFDRAWGAVLGALARHFEA